MMSFSDIDTSSVRPSQFPQIQREIQGSTDPRTTQIDDKKPFATSGDQSLFLGDITLRLQGEFKVKPCREWEFNGTLKSYDDVYDFNGSTHRGLLGELLTAFGRSTPGAPFDIQIRGAKPISETGRMG